MKDQHTKIKGYRELSQEEIDLMIEIKEVAQKTKELVEKLYEYNQDILIGMSVPSTSNSQISDEDWLRNEQQLECLEQASPNLQQGFMWLTRSVALPESW